MSKLNLSKKKFLRVDEVAKILSLGRSRIYDLINDNELPAYKTGTNGNLRILTEDLEEYMENNKVDPLDLKAINGKYQEVS